MTAIIIGKIAEIIHAIIYLCGQIFIFIVFLEVFTRKRQITKNGIVVPIINAFIGSKKEN